MNKDPGPDEICMMCHLSSECPKCCNKCGYIGSCGKQICMQGEKEQYGRYDAWMTIIRENIHYKQLINKFNKIDNIWFKKKQQHYGIHRKQLALF